MYEPSVFIARYRYKLKHLFLYSDQEVERILKEDLEAIKIFAKIFANVDLIL